jgi:hypothetical protein
MTTERPAKFFHTHSLEMFDRIFVDYKQQSKAVLSLIKHDRKLSRFDAFNKRLKISCGLNISFSDDLGIVRDDTRSCYALMYRISDIWYAFEHLLSVADTEISRLSKSKTVLYPPDVLIATGLVEVERIFGQLIDENVTREPSWRRELYPMLAYFINNTNGGTRKALEECSARVKAKERFRLQELLAISYGLRNLYVHEGVMAAMGGRDYALKRRLYEVVLDCLTLAAFTLGSAYAKRVVTKWSEKAVMGGAAAAQSPIADDGTGLGVAGS